MADSRLVALTYVDKIQTYNTDNVTKKISTLTISYHVYIVIDSRAETITQTVHTYAAYIILKHTTKKKEWIIILESLIVDRFHILNSS